MCASMDGLQEVLDFEAEGFGALEVELLEVEAGGGVLGHTFRG